MADVAWVASSSVTTGSGTTLSATTPAGIANGDTLLATLYARNVITPPAGWTLVDQSADFTNGSITQRIYLYSKDTVTSANSSTSYSWTQPSALAVGIIYTVTRNVSAVTVAKSAVSSTSTWSITPAVSTADNNGQLLLIFASQINSASAEVPTIPAGTTSIAVPTSGRMAASRQVVQSGEFNGGTFNFSPSGSPASSNGLGALTVRLSTSSPSPNQTRLLLPGILGNERLRVQHRAVARVSVASMLGQARGLVWIDFSGLVAGQTPRYEMRLTTGSGTFVVPVSSWQATLQGSASSYVQCTVPACQPWVDTITAATSFAIFRIGTINGAPFAHEMISAAVGSRQLAQGPQRNTANITGNAPGAAADADLPSSLNRALVDARSVATEPRGLRVRCAIDWLLRPGMNAVIDDTTFVVGTISYQVGDGDQYMDVTEEPT